MDRTFLPAIAKTEDKGLRTEDAEKARAVFDRMASHPEQRRPALHWNETLAHVAQAYCVRQALEGFASHVDPAGYGANHRLRAAGYRLPDWYEQEPSANNVESLSHNGDGTLDGKDGPEYGVWQPWMRSPGHKTHILGLDPFYAAQTCVGVGYFAGGEKSHYWCVMSAPAADPGFSATEAEKPGDEEV